MKILKKIGAEMLGLFVEDLSFAIALAIWVIAALFVMPSAGFSKTAQAITFCAGLIFILVENVIRCARRPK